MNKHHNKYWLLKTVDENMRAYNDFQYPNIIGATITAPDFLPTKECGNGLHAYLNGEGDAISINWDSTAKWLVLSTTEEPIDLDGKVKVKSATLEFIGDQKTATNFLRSQIGDGYKIIGGTHIVGNNKTAQTGDGGTAIAGNYGTAITDYKGTAKTGDKGTAIAGDYGTAQAGNYGIAQAGYYGIAQTGYNGTAIAGYYGTAITGYYGTAKAGCKGTAIAGDYGIIQIKYWDEKCACSRYKIGYIGENGLKPNTKYQLDKNHNFKEVK